MYRSPKLKLSSIQLTIKNLSLFAENLHRVWVKEAFHTLYKEVRDGLWEGLGCMDPLPETWLSFFTTSELKSIICGDNDISWTEDELRQYITFHGWEEAIELEKKTHEFEHLFDLGNEI